MNKGCSNSYKMEGKSLLNPDATPYVPLSKESSGISSKEENKLVKNAMIDSELNEDTSDFQLPNSISEEYSVLYSEQQHGFEGSTSTAAFTSSDIDDQTFQDYTSGSDKDNIIDDRDFIMDSLSSLFPNMSLESLASLFDANHGDLNETINMLEHLEFDGSSPRELPETSHVRSNVGPYEEGGSSRTRDSI